MTTKLPTRVRARAIRAGRAAKAQCRANGGSPEAGHAAYRRSYNVERARFLYLTDAQFRARAVKACKEWRERHAA